MVYHIICSSDILKNIISKKISFYVSSFSRSKPKNPEFWGIRDFLLLTSFLLTLISIDLDIFKKSTHNIMGDKMLKVIIRTVLMYAFVSLGVRLMGKRQIGDMQPTELVVTLLISEIAAIPLQDISQPVSIGLVAIFMLVFLEIVASVLVMKNLRLRRIFSGKSVVVIRGGVVDQKAMKSVRMTVFDLIEMLRMQGIFDINEVESAVLEINGNLSVRQKPESSPATAAQLGIKLKDSGMPVTVISDGVIIDASLKFLGKTRADLNTILEKAGAEAKEIFIMTLDGGDNEIIIKKDKNI